MNVVATVLWCFNDFKSCCWGCLCLCVALYLCFILSVFMFLTEYHKINDVKIKTHFAFWGLAQLSKSNIQALSRYLNPKCPTHLSFYFKCNYKSLQLNLYLQQSIFIITVFILPAFNSTFFYQPWMSYVHFVACHMWKDLLFSCSDLKL